MSMTRRDFIKLAGLTGLSLVAPWSSKEAAAQTAPYTGPLWIMIHANGGWDPTSFCDPKGRASTTDPQPMNMYLTSAIGQTGPFKYAPVGNNKAFFEKHASKLLVINGVDTATNNHDVGTRVCWSGSMVDHFPGFAALVAGAYGSGQPMAFITNGGYDETAGLIAPSRMGNIDSIKRVAFPNAMDANNPDNDKYHTDTTFARIQAARDARHQALMAQQKLPRMQSSMSQLYLARNSNNELKKLTDHLPADLNPPNTVLRQARLAMAAYKAGLSVSVNINIGGFDTHSNHDNSHIPLIQTMLEGVDQIWDEADRQQITNNIVIVMASDFGRTPGYNAGNGKDHWSITSMLLMGKGITGNRVIGSTTDRHIPMTVNPATLQEDSKGIRITPAHVHKALRKLAGIETHPLVQRYAINTESLPIFT